MTPTLYYGIPAGPISSAFCSSVLSPSGTSRTYRLPGSGASAPVRPFVLPPLIVSDLWDCTISHPQRCSTRWKRPSFSRMPQSIWPRSCPWAASTSASLDFPAEAFLTSILYTVSLLPPTPQPYGSMRSLPPGRQSTHRFPAFGIQGICFRTPPSFSLR